MTDKEKTEFIKALNFCREDKPFTMEDIHIGFPPSNQAVIMYTEKGNTLLGEYKDGDFYKVNISDGKFRDFSPINNVIGWVECK